MVFIEGPGKYLVSGLDHVTLSTAFPFFFTGIVEKLPNNLVFVVESSSSTTDIAYSQSIRFVTSILSQQSNSSDVIVVRYGSSAHILASTSGTSNAIRILEASHRVDLGANNITAALEFVVQSLSSTADNDTIASDNATTSENSLTLNVNNSRSLLFQISTSVETVDVTTASSLSASIQNLGLESYVVTDNVNTAAGLEVLASQPASGHVFVCNGDLSNVDSVVTTMQPYLKSGWLKQCLKLFSERKVDNYKPA